MEISAISIPERRFFVNEVPQEISHKEKGGTLLPFLNLSEIGPELLDRICGIFLLTGQ
jgi:hypothetical protein